MTLSERRVGAELLDALPASDPRAARSRRDLRRINRWMGNAASIARLTQAAGTRRLRRIVEIGAGDGTFVGSLAKHLAREGEAAEVILVDRQPFAFAAAARQLRVFGWRLEAVQAEVIDWLTRAQANPADLMIANLFLHHFADADLARLLHLAARKTACFVACEPRRCPTSLTAARLLGLAGCNEVTRHDAVLSVRAGFRGRELSARWPDAQGWRLREGRAGWFSHGFLARRAGAEG